MDIDTLREVEKLAREFKCCPDCGSENIGPHLCNVCFERIIEPLEAYYFADKLNKLIQKLEEEKDGR
ncbi:MAG: hypothetical protein A2Z57_07060 [Planctomycetes bacterium RIFCSPHIGHO2_12_39_6]|nr:MAG: hypothetical protein A2Z57_07060 [Planctomycetes bacterium RIFCSPHIGHO2_12_39_6]